MEPLFKTNYRAYDKEEFLLDADMEFYKIKKLLEKNPKVLKEDPLMSIDYLKVINLIKRKKLVENTSDQYAPQDQSVSTFYDIDDLELQKRLKQESADEKLKKQMQMEEAASGDTFTVEDEEVEASIRANKKREEREKAKLLKQFDALATQFEKSSKTVQTQEQTESAGSLKKKTKQKKEKTMAAKLRLKEKKK